MLLVIAVAFPAGARLCRENGKPLGAVGERDGQHKDWKEEEKPSTGPESGTKLAPLGLVSGAAPPVPQQRHPWRSSLS